VDGGAIVTVPLSLQAVAQFDPQTVAGFSWTVGLHTMDATFRDTNSPHVYSDATLVPTYNQTVTQNSVTLTLASTPAVDNFGPIYGQPLTVTATLTP